MENLELPEGLDFVEALLAHQGNGWRAWRQGLRTLDEFCIKDCNLAGIYDLLSLLKQTLAEFARLLLLEVATFCKRTSSPAFTKQNQLSIFGAAKKVTTSSRSCFLPEELLLHLALPGVLSGPRPGERPEQLRGGAAPRSGGALGWDWRGGQGEPGHGKKMEKWCKGRRGWFKSVKVKNMWRNRPDIDQKCYFCGVLCEMYGGKKGKIADCLWYPGLCSTVAGGCHPADGLSVAFGHWRRGIDASATLGEAVPRAPRAAELLPVTAGRAEGTVSDAWVYGLMLFWGARCTLDTLEWEQSIKLLKKSNRFIMVGVKFARCSFCTLWL